MFVENNFFDNESAKRLSVGVIGAVLTHVLILVWFSLPSTEKIISANTFSPPTNVSIRFVTPIKDVVIQKQPERVVDVKPVKKKPVVHKTAKVPVQKPTLQELNKIEPAAAPQQPLEISKPVRDIIPVISEASVKGRRVQPEYPKRALRMHQQGVVWLHVLIGEDGGRQKIKLHKPSQYALLNQAALKAVKKWTFDPNVVNGRAVQSWVEIPIEFKIQ